MSKSCLEDLANLPVARLLASLFISLTFDGPLFFDAQKQPLRGTSSKPCQPTAILLPAGLSLVTLAKEGDRCITNPSSSHMTMPGTTILTGSDKASTSAMNCCSDSKWCNRMFVSMINNVSSSDIASCLFNDNELLTYKIA